MLLDFSSAIFGTVEDKDFEGTGFTTVQSNNNGDQYNPSRINLDTTAGTLTLTANKEENGKGSTVDVVAGLDWANINTQGSAADVQ